jgi:hypothetical protein
MAVVNSHRKLLIETLHVSSTAILLTRRGRQNSSNGMIFGAAYSHTDMLKMGFVHLFDRINLKRHVQCISDHSSPNSHEQPDYTHQLL